MRSAGGTKSGPPSVVVAATSRGSPACRAVVPRRQRIVLGGAGGQGKRPRNAARPRRPRRVSAENAGRHRQLLPDQKRDPKPSLRPAGRQSMPSFGGGVQAASVAWVSAGAAARLRLRRRGRGSSCGAGSAGAASTAGISRARVSTAGVSAGAGRLGLGRFLGGVGLDAQLAHQEGRHVVAHARGPARRVRGDRAPARPCGAPGSAEAEAWRPARGGLGGLALGVALGLALGAAVRRGGRAPGAAARRRGSRGARASKLSSLFSGLSIEWDGLLHQFLDLGEVFSSCGRQSVIDLPERPARPVRPMRWT